MGLIRKQGGFDLSLKIEDWLNTCERFKTSLRWRYVFIAPDYTIKVNNFYRSFVFEQIVYLGELPDYIMFDFTGCQPIEYPKVKMDISEVIEQLNKASNNIMGIDRCTIRITVREAYDLQKDEHGEWYVVDQRYRFEEPKI